MAGSGKSTCVSGMVNALYSSDKQTDRQIPYVVNCDPACHHLPFPCQVDIRDTVNYKQVMKQYKLGPNGAIITSLNLFSTQFEQVLKLIDKRKDEHEYDDLQKKLAINHFVILGSSFLIHQDKLKCSLGQLQEASSPNHYHHSIQLSLCMLLILSEAKIQLRSCQTCYMLVQLFINANFQL